METTDCPAALAFVNPAGKNRQRLCSKVNIKSFEDYLKLGLPGAFGRATSNGPGI
ncbi:hypothetical protein [Bradyrhizobium sacchari]|uniref:hypothetical protein n=1 Tax=Bradyrhizobium sacchari TaxID=1399419 RepID=UPI00137481E6|nr:hypothetical protein [Bradyrhizobium sacchari]